MDKWKKIWNKDERVNNIILESLIKADGFDSGAGSFSVGNWCKYTSELYQEMGIKPDNSIYDIGCGSGAFVYPLHLNKHMVGGVDYSMILIKLANKIINNNFICDDATNIKVNEKYDFIVSHSVFQYFESLDYAKKVIFKMYEKANKTIAIFDISDKSKEERYHEIRMSQMNAQEYKDKYKGLEHMFYTKKWFEEIALDLDCKLNIFDQSFKEYSNSGLRFNVIMEKR